jgi:glycosyltransferase involved in cell wall biosynthesis
VIAAEAGALPEVVGEAALRVDPRSVGAIGSAMAALIQQPALAAQLGEAGLLQAARFRWEDTGRAVEELLRQLA